MLARVAVVAALVSSTVARAGTGTDAATGTGSETGTGSGTGSDTASGPDPDLSTSRRAAAIGLAIIPGIAYRGLGSRVAREPTTSRRLLKLAGIGLGALVVGGVPLAATYGSGKLIVPGVPLILAGTGLVLGSWWSDIYAAAGGRRLRGGPRDLAALEVGGSVQWQHDGYRGERFYVTPELIARRGRWALGTSAFVTEDAGSFGGRVEVTARLWGRHRGERDTGARHTASFVDVRGALYANRERDLHLTLATLEVELRGRLDLGELDRNLRGAFLELTDGGGLELASYQPGPTDVTAMLLGRIVWGTYLPCERGEISVFYDHRRDHRAGGLAAGRAAGFFGSIGASTEVVVARGLTVIGQGEIGSAWVTTIGLRKELP